MSTVRINDGNGSYICEYGHLHGYDKISKKEIEEILNNSTCYESVEDLMNEIEKE